MLRRDVTETGVTGSRSPSASQVCCYVPVIPTLRRLDRKPRRSKPAEAQSETLPQNKKVTTAKKKKKYFMYKIYEVGQEYIKTVIVS